MFLLVVIGEFDFFEFSLNVWILDLRAFDVSEDLFGFAVSTLANQPPRRLWKPWYCCVKNDNEDELERKRDSPSYAARTI
jgi:hypothetical protein